MATSNSNSPELRETVQLIADQILCEVHTSMPAVVVDYSAATQTATVQPTLQRRYVGESPINLPKIFQVSVIFPRVKNAWLRLPIAAGDLVDLHFSERSLDAWSQTDGSAPLDPAIPHKFNMSDAIATPGLYPQSQAIQALAAAGSLELANGGGWVGVTSAGKFQLSNASGDLLALLQTIATDLKTLIADVAAFTAPPSGGPLIPSAAYPADLVTLTADLAKLPGFLP